MKMADLIRKSPTYMFYADGPLSPAAQKALSDKYLINDFPLTSPVLTNGVDPDPLVPLQSADIPSGPGVLAYSMDLAAFTPSVAHMVTVISKDPAVKIACRVISVAKNVTVVNIYISATIPSYMP